MILAYIPKALICICKEKSSTFFGAIFHLDRRSVDLLSREFFESYVHTKNCDFVDEIALDLQSIVIWLWKSMLTSDQFRET